MNKFITYVIAILITIISTVPLYANEDDQEDSEIENTSILYNKKGKGRREKPGRVHIICHYREGHISFALPPHIHTLQVSIGGEDDPEWQGWIDSSYPEADIPTLYGDYEIVCRTPNNQIFKGNLQFAN